MEPIQVMIEDLGRQIAQKAVEAAEWKARAIIAEAALQAAAAAEGEDEATGLALVPNGDEGEETETP
jgi:hypothetical protein